MLAMSIGTRTMSTNDPLIEKTLAVALEFNDLTGKSPPGWYDAP